MHKGGFELWILTKIAMLFFIIALAAIMLSMSNIQKNASCSNQAQNSVDSIGAKISQLLYSPSEDERQAYSFTTILPLGEGGAKYTLNMTFRERESNASYLSLEIASPSAGCNAGTIVAVGNQTSTEVILFSRPGMNFAKQNDFYLFEPSLLDYASRSKYMVLVKCTQKRPGGKKLIFIEDCKEDDYSKCSMLNFDKAGNVIDMCCGWDNTVDCPYS